MTRFRWDRRSGRTSAGRRRFAPGVGMLEERSLLSTLTVTNTNDSGPGSLRAEIDQAASGDTIDFADDVRGTIALQSSLTIFDKSLTIDGPGASELTISGGGQVQDIVIAANPPGSQSVTIAGLTIADGFAPIIDYGYGPVPGSGGAIATYGVPLTLNNDVLTHNSATGDGGAIQAYASLTLNNDVLSQNSATGNGGAISAGFGTSLVIAGSVFDANTAGTSPTSGVHRGGAISASMPTSVSDSIFTTNLVQGSIANGGAIQMNFGTPLTVTGSTFASNRAIGTYVSGGALAGDPGTTLAITGSHFLGNVVNGSNTASGGAVTISMASFSFPPQQSTIAESDFDGNLAVGSVGLFGAGNAQGGAVSSSGGTLVVNNVRFRANQAVGASVVDGDGGSATGGGLYVTSGTLQLSGGLFLGNRAIAGDGSTGFRFASGGGLQLIFGPFNGATSTVTDSRFVGNQAVGGVGGQTISQGGGLFDLSVPLTLTNTDFIGNSALGGTGGPGEDGTLGEGGAVYGNVAFGGTLTINGGQFVANQAIGGNAGAGGGNGGNGQGGAIANEGTMTISGIHVSGNRAVGGDAPDGTGGDGLGGGVYTNFGSIVIANSMITGNAALGGSGATDGQGFGGGLDVAGGTATVKTSKIVGNHASTAGDNIYGTTTG